LLAGTSGSSAGIRVYRGVPFAAPPVGDLRWKAPQPSAKWEGVRQAAEFSNACWQTPYPAAAAIYQAKLPPLSEDCLYLNIWTPAKSAKDRLPVMVWIHGGGFTRGFSGTSSYNGEVLARKGAVIVTINYRLGIFGFFAHPELSAESGHHASGNYALLDQIAALQWVQKNIAVFGGDPARAAVEPPPCGANGRDEREQTQGPVRSQSLQAIGVHERDGRSGEGATEERCQIAGQCGVDRRRWTVRMAEGRLEQVVPSFHLIRVVSDCVGA